MHLDLRIFRYFKKKNFFFFACHFSNCALSSILFLHQSNVALKAASQYSLKQRRSNGLWS